ncbi:MULTISPECIES: ParB/RepB/Spo0J family partition protein [unclassified Bradyrhizobium]
MKRSRKIEPIPISAITVPNSRQRTRAPFNEIVRSIRNLGLKRPIVVSNHKRTGSYELVCGEGRIEAFVALDQNEIPAIVVDVSTEDCILMSLVENIARRRHWPVELVGEIGRLARHYATSEIAAKLDLEPERIRAIVYLLKHGEERLISAVERGVVPPTLALEIARAKSPKLQGLLLEAHIKEQHTSRQIAMMRRIVEQRHRNAARINASDNQIDPVALVRAYRRETDRQKLVARKAELTQARLLFIVNALRTLLSQRMFTSLLREEGLDKLPLPILRRISASRADRP